MDKCSDVIKSPTSSLYLTRYPQALDSLRRPPRVTRLITHQALDSLRVAHPTAVCTSVKQATSAVTCRWHGLTTATLFHVSHASSAAYPAEMP